MSTISASIVDGTTVRALTSELISVRTSAEDVAMTLDMTSGRPDLTVASALERTGRGPVDLVAAELAAADFLAALGIDIGQEGLRETPARMARAYAELFAPQPFHMTTF